MEVARQTTIDVRPSLQHLALQWRLRPRASTDLTCELAATPAPSSASQRFGSSHSRWRVVARWNYSKILSDLIEAFEAWGEHEPEPTILASDRQPSITAVTGKLSHCRDFVPNRPRRFVREHVTPSETTRAEETLSTDAQAARIMRRRIREAAAR